MDAKFHQRTTVPIAFGMIGSPPLRLDVADERDLLRTSDRRPMRTDRLNHRIKPQRVCRHQWELSGCGSLRDGTRIVMRRR